MIADYDVNAPAPQLLAVRLSNLYLSACFRHLKDSYEHGTVFAV